MCLRSEIDISWLRKNVLHTKWEKSKIFHSRRFRDFSNHSFRSHGLTPKLYARLSHAMKTAPGWQRRQIYEPLLRTEPTFLSVAKIHF